MHAHVEHTSQEAVTDTAVPVNANVICTFPGGGGAVPQGRKVSAHNANCVAYIVAVCAYVYSL